MRTASDASARTSSWSEPTDSPAPPERRVSQTCMCVCMNPRRHYELPLSATSHCMPGTEINSSIDVGWSMIQVRSSDSFPRTGRYRSSKFVFALSCRGLRYMLFTNSSFSALVSGPAVWVAGVIPELLACNFAVSFRPRLRSLVRDVVEWAGLPFIIAFWAALTPYAMTTAGSEH